MMHSTHFIYSHMASDIWYRTTQIVRVEFLCHHYMGYSFRLGFFYMHHCTDRIAHIMAFVTLVVEHWLQQEIAQWVHHERSIQQPITL